MSEMEKLEALKTSIGLLGEEIKEGVAEMAVRLWFYAKYQVLRDYPL